MSIEFTYPSQYPRFEPQFTPAPAGSALAQAAGVKTLEPQLSQAPGEHSFFKDLLDVVNPLQQLPIIGTLYRSLTGDTISPVSRMAGGMLLGGPIGFAIAAINAAIEDGTGKDMGEHLVAMVSGGGSNQYANAAYQKTAALS